jgi:hypothetical protein
VAIVEEHLPSKPKVLSSNTSTAKELQPGAGGSHPQSWLLRRCRSGESHFKDSPGKIVFETLSQKKPSQKRAGGVTQGIGLEFKPQYHKSK